MAVNNVEGNESRPFVTQEQVKHGAAKVAAVMAIATAVFLIVAVASHKLLFKHVEIQQYGRWTDKYVTINTIANFSQTMGRAAILTGSISALALLLAAGIQRHQDNSAEGKGYQSLA